MTVDHYEMCAADVFYFVLFHTLFLSSIVAESFVFKLVNYPSMWYRQSCCCFLPALDQGSYVTGLGEASIPQVTKCYFGFVEQKSDGIILIEMVAACIFQYWTFSH